MYKYQDFSIFQRHLMNFMAYYFFKTLNKASERTLCSHTFVRQIGKVAFTYKCLIEFFQAKHYSRKVTIKIFSSSDLLITVKT